VEFAASKAMMAIVAWKFVLTPSIAMLVMKSWSTQRMEHYTRLVIKWMIVMATLRVNKTSHNISKKKKTSHNRKSIIMHMILVYMILYLQCIILFSNIIVSSYDYVVESQCKIGYKMYLLLNFYFYVLILLAEYPCVATAYQKNYKSQ
jgi:hypothetical protein